MNIKTLNQFKEIVTSNVNTPNLFFVHIGSYAKSGLSRTMKFYIDNQDVTEFVGYILGKKTDKKGYIRIRGGGMDMIFDTLHSLVCALGVGSYLSKCVTTYNYNYFDFIKR